MEIQLAQNYLPHLLKSIGISPKRLDRTIRTIKEFFSEPWLEEIKTFYETDRGYQVFKHPIYTGLLKGEVTIETPIVVELSSCLEALRTKANLARIVENLKNPDVFDDYFYELSTAYRLNFLDPNLQLAPLICGKTPDSVIEYEGKKCAVECTVMSGSNTYARFHDAMEQLGSLVFHEARVQEFPCNIHLVAKHESITSDEKIAAMKLEVQRLIARKVVPDVIENDFCKISILPINERPSAEMGMIESIAPSEALHEVSLTGSTRHPQEYLAGFFVSYQPIRQSLHRDLERRIYEKINTKCAQVRPLRDTHNIFLFIDIDVSWRQLMERRDEISHEIVSNFFRNSNDLFSLIVLTSRPRGKNDLFAINRMVHGRPTVDESWLGNFWSGFMQPSVNNNFFLRTTGRNDSCPCGIGLKFKQCHGFYL